MTSPVTPRWGFAVVSGILGWVLDAFDFFVLVFLFDVLAAHFHVGKASIVATITLTLAMRPVGALLLGSLADRYGRKRPLMLCVVFFSIVTALTPFAPSYAVFVLLRGLYGIGMGGYWGIGASLVVESAPVRWRGLFSGIMQSGYAMGYLCAAIAMRTAYLRLGWQSMFFLGLPMAVLIVGLTLLSPESAAWQKTRLGSIGEILPTLVRHKKTFAYCVLLMSVMVCLSHGTQDLYPDFLKSEHKFPGLAVANLAILYNVFAVFGALVLGNFSDRLGRRRTAMLSLTLCLLAIPAWAFGPSWIVLAVGSCAMQFGVQGAFGIIPAHLNELAPHSVRVLFPGLVYQLGTFFGGVSVYAEFALKNRVGYSWALTGFEVCVILTLMLLFGFGPERTGRDLAVID